MGGDLWLDHTGHCVLSAPAAPAHGGTRFLGGKGEKCSIPKRVSSGDQGTPPSGCFWHGRIRGLSCLVSASVRPALPTL